MHGAQLTQPLQGWYTCCGQALCGHACMRVEALEHILGSNTAARPAQLAASMGAMEAAHLNSRLEVLRPQVLIQSGHAQARQELVLKDEPCLQQAVTTRRSDCSVVAVGGRAGGAGTCCLDMSGLGGRALPGI